MSMTSEDKDLKDRLVKLWGGNNNARFRAASASAVDQNPPRSPVRKLFNESPSESLESGHKPRNRSATSVQLNGYSQPDRQEVKSPESNRDARRPSLGNGVSVKPSFMTGETALQGRQEGPVKFTIGRMTSGQGGSAKGSVVNGRVTRTGITRLMENFEKPSLPEPQSPQHSSLKPLNSQSPLKAPNMQSPIKPPSPQIPPNVKNPLSLPKLQGTLDLNQQADVPVERSQQKVVPAERSLSRDFEEERIPEPLQRISKDDFRRALQHMEDFLFRVVQVSDNKPKGVREVYEN